MFFLWVEANLFLYLPLDSLQGPTACLGSYADKEENHYSAKWSLLIKKVQYMPVSEAALSLTRTQSSDLKPLGHSLRQIIVILHTNMKFSLLLTIVMSDISQV